MKKRSERRKHCAPKIFASPQTPFPGEQDRQNLISWRRSLPTPTDPVWWRSMHAISSYRGNRHRPPARCKQTGPITIHCAAKLSAQCINTATGTYSTSRNIGFLGITRLSAQCNYYSIIFSAVNLFVLYTKTYISMNEFAGAAATNDHYLVWRNFFSEYSVYSGTCTTSTVLMTFQ